MHEPEPGSNLEPEGYPAVESIPLTTLIGVVEKQVTKLATFYPSTKDLIKAEMGETPRLELTVQQKMEEALTPEETRLIGETSLVV